MIGINYRLITLPTLGVTTTTSKTKSYDLKIVNMAKKLNAQAEILDYTNTTVHSFRAAIPGKAHIPYKESSDKPSQTLPDRTMTISQMLKRTQQGLPINNGGMEPIWNGERLLPKWKSLDLIDRAKIVAEAKADVELKKKRLDSARKAKYDADLAAKVKEELEKQNTAQTGSNEPKPTA